MPRYYLMINEQKAGPYTTHEIDDLFWKERVINRETLCLREDLEVTEWKPIKKYIHFPRLQLYAGSASLARERLTVSERSVRLGSVIGFFAGGLVAFLLRPSAPLIGQLPFNMVISRGSNLSGLDQLLIPVAEASFNYMFMGAILGGVGGLLIAYLLSKNSSIATLRREREGQSTIPKNPENVTENIRRLAQLKEEGFLTAEEFQEKKAELLKRL